MTVSLAVVLLLSAAPADAVTIIPPEPSAPSPEASPALAPPPETPATPPASASPANTISDGDDILVAGRKHVAEDPLASINIQTYQAIQTVDRAFVGPVAMGYKNGVPEPVRDGLRNFLRNVNEPVVFVNYLLQLKPGKAVHTAGRFLVNSTLGVAGLVDVARRKPFKLAWHDNGFANTLGCYGVKPGAFLFVPLIGSTSVRDLFGLGLDKLFLPAIVGKPFNRPYYSLPAGAIDSLNDRIELDGQLQTLRAAADPYTSTRALYFKQREADIVALCGRHKGAAAPLVPPAITAP